MESTCHYLFHCSLNTNVRLALLNVIQGIDNSILELSHSHIVKVLLHGRKLLDKSSKTNILNATVDFLIKINRFDERLFLNVKSTKPWLLAFTFFKFNFFL